MCYHLDYQTTRTIVHPILGRQRSVAKVTQNTQHVPMPKGGQTNAVSARHASADPSRASKIEAAMQRAMRDFDALFRSLADK